MQKKFNGEAFIQAVPHEEDYHIGEEGSLGQGIKNVIWYLFKEGEKFSPGILQWISKENIVSYEKDKYFDVNISKSMSELQLNHIIYLVNNYLIKHSNNYSIENNLHLVKRGNIDTPLFSIRYFEAQ